MLCPGKPVVGPQLWSNSFLPGIYQGTHINNATIDPDRIIRDIANRHLTTPAQREQLDLLQPLNREHLEARGRDDPLEARIASLEMAFRMQFEAHEAFDLGRETDATRSLYGDGRVRQRLPDRPPAGRARRPRSSRSTTATASRGTTTATSRNHRDHAQKSDQPIAALLNDLKARGLLDDTLVIWGGEFGRTPTSEGAKGRDHHNLGFTMWLAGGGVKGGHVHGATDEFGFARRRRTGCTSTTCTPRSCT